MVTRKAVLVGFVAGGLFAGTGTSGCGGGGDATVQNAQTRLAPPALYSTWRLTQVSGGITGTGYPVTEDTRITFSEGGRVLETVGGRINLDGQFRVTRTTTQFGGTKPVIDFFVTNGSETTSDRLPRVVHRADSGQLSLADEAADGYQYTYVRAN